MWLYEKPFHEQTILDSMANLNAENAHKHNDICLVDDKNTFSTSFMTSLKQLNINYQLVSFIN